MLQLTPFLFSMIKNIKNKNKTGTININILYIFCSFLEKKPIIFKYSLTPQQFADVTVENASQRIGSVMRKETVRVVRMRRIVRSRL